MGFTKLDLFLELVSGTGESDSTFLITVGDSIYTLRSSYIA